MPLANVSRPMGFRAYKQGGRANYITKQRPVLANRVAVGTATGVDLAIGDAYALDPNGNAYHAGPDAKVQGIVIGFKFQASSAVMGGAGPVSIDYLPAANSGFVIGIEDPDAQFTVQSDTFSVADILGEYNLADALPDSVLRQSRQTISIGGGAGTQFRTMDIEPSTASNAYGANAQVLVKLLQVS